MVISKRSVKNADWEIINLSTNPKFLAIIERSRARQEAEGSISSDEMRRRLGLKQTYRTQPQNRFDNINVPAFHNQKNGDSSLGAEYRYITPQLQISVRSESQGLKAGVFRPRVVYDWSTSPFVLINPHRIALVGRNLLLQLGVDIILKASVRSTIVL